MERDIIKSSTISIKLTCLDSSHTHTNTVYHLDRSFQEMEHLSSTVTITHTNQPITRWVTSIEAAKRWDISAVNCGVNRLGTNIKSLAHTNSLS